MVKTNLKDFGECAVDAIRNHLKQNETTWNKLNAVIVSRILQSAFEQFTHQPELAFEGDASVPLPELGGAGRARKKPAERDPLFDCLALSTGCRSLAEITKTQGRSIAVALAEILKVSPSLTCEEIERRVLCYKRLHRDWPLTANSMAKNWSEFAINPETAQQKLDPYKTPADWRSRFNQTFPGIEAPADWQSISVPLRTDILRKTS